MTSDAIHCFDRACVLFAVHPKQQDAPRIVCEISEDALRDVFGARGGPDDLVETCRRHFDVIKGAALHQYSQCPLGAVKLEAADFSRPPIFAMDSVEQAASPDHVEAVGQPAS
jgi:hypothetical protein